MSISRHSVTSIITDRRIQMRARHECAESGRDCRKRGLSVRRRRRSGFAPALLAKFGDLTRKAHERVFHSMPVRVALMLEDSLIVVLGDFPTGRAGAANMKGSDAITVLADTWSAIGDAGIQANF
jgi:hypothetical protein